MKNYHHKNGGIKSNVLNQTVEVATHDFLNDPNTDFKIMTNGNSGVILLATNTQKCFLLHDNQRHEASNMECNSLIVKVMVIEPLENTVHRRVDVNINYPNMKKTRDSGDSTTVSIDPEYLMNIELEFNIQKDCYEKSKNSDKGAICPHPLGIFHGYPDSISVIPNFKKNIHITRDKDFNEFAVIIMEMLKTNDNSLFYSLQDFLEDEYVSKRHPPYEVNSKTFPEINLHFEKGRELLCDLFRFGFYHNDWNANNIFFRRKKAKYQSDIYYYNHPHEPIPYIIDFGRARRVNKAYYSDDMRQSMANAEILQDIMSQPMSDFDDVTIIDFLANKGEKFDPNNSYTYFYLWIANNVKSPETPPTKINPKKRKRKKTTTTTTTTTTTRTTRELKKGGKRKTRKIW